MATAAGARYQLRSAAAALLWRRLTAKAKRFDMHYILDQKARKTAIRETTLLREMQGRVFINFMPNIIYDAEICLRTTMEAAHAYGMPLSFLVFEVVETEQIPDMKN